jgi:hypothetical protein
MLRIPHCLDSRLTDGGKVVSPTHRPHSNPQKHDYSASDTRDILLLGGNALDSSLGVSRFESRPGHWPF